MVAISLSLWPVALSSNTAPTTSFATIREAELLLSESSNNLTNIDTSMKINMDIQHYKGLSICTNLVFFCHLVIAVQCNHNSDHPIPFLHIAAMQISNVNSKQSLLDMVWVKQVELVSFLVIACLENIFSLRKQTLILIRFILLVPTP